MIDFDKPAPVVKKRGKYNIDTILALKTMNYNDKRGRKNK
jgi:hypothetical protein